MAVAARGAERAGARGRARRARPRLGDASTSAGTGVDLRLGDMADAFADLDGTVDVVVSNPPYIPLDAWESVAPEARDHDPALALWSGDDGLDAIRVVERRPRCCCGPGEWSASSTPTPRASPRRRCSRPAAVGRRPRPPRPGRSAALLTARLAR